MMVAKGMVPATSELSITAPPIIPANALAMLKAEIFAVAAISGATVPYFITRIWIGGTLTKEVMQKPKDAARNAHLAHRTFYVARHNQSDETRRDR
jgi:hypothetical protein